MRLVCDFGLAFVFSHLMFSGGACSCSNPHRGCHTRVQSNHYAERPSLGHGDAAAGQGRGPHDFSADASKIGRLYGRQGR
jgi:hypothetical protein